MVESESVVGFCTPSDIKKAISSLDISEMVAPVWKEGVLDTKIKMEKKAPYGYCPFCSAPGKGRERRPNGNDTCENGHVYQSSQAIIEVKDK